MSERVKLKPGKLVEMKFPVSVSQDIIYTMAPLPSFQERNLKLIHYKFTTGSKVESEENILKTLKIKLENADLINLFVLKMTRNLFFHEVK